MNLMSNLRNSFSSILDVFFDDFLFDIVNHMPQCHNFSNRSDEGLMLETSAFLPFTVANLRFQPSC